MFLSPTRPLPLQRADLVLLHGERWRRSATAMKLWSETAAKCVRFVENDQWDEADRKILEKQRRPVLTINKIAPLVNLILGYHINNLVDIRYLPGHDGTGSADMARVLNHVGKNIAQLNQTEYLDLEMIQDGVVTGRGFQDWRIDFSENDLGQVRVTTVDPFSVYLDPDAMEYDLNRHSFVMTSKWLSIEEVEHWYGRRILEMVMPLTQGMTFQNSDSGMIAGFDDVEITPWRRFGGEDSEVRHWQMQAEELFHDWIDRQRRQVRMMESQHYVLTQQTFIVDLDSGERMPVPDTWGADKVEKVRLWAREMNYPLSVETRPTRRLRLTQMIGDIIVHDAWSPYPTMTLIGFFPRFRRGRTLGLVEPLLGVQEEINRTRSARQNIVGRLAAAGWKIEKKALDAQGLAHHEKNGATPGYTMLWDSQGGKIPEPKMIEVQDSQMPWESLEKDAASDLEMIAGFNPAALGQVENNAASGVQVLARQRQAVMGLELPMANYRRTKTMFGYKQLELVQRWYTEQRIIRVLGRNELNPVSIIINQATAAGVINDITAGKFAVVVDDTPVSASFLEGQFRELLEMKGLGMPIPDDHIIDASSIPRKEELKHALAAERQAQQALAAAGAAPAGSGQTRGPGPGGSMTGTDGGSLPNSGGEPGLPTA